MSITFFIFFIPSFFPIDLMTYESQDASKTSSLFVAMTLEQAMTFIKSLHASMCCNQLA
jgi:hypothetical protein